MSNYKLIGVGNNAKTVKGDGSEYLTAILYLAPADLALGYILDGSKLIKLDFTDELYCSTAINLCPMAETAGCKPGCLNSAGRGAMNTVQNARIRKAVMLRDTPELFFDLLRTDLDKFQKYCQKRDIQPVVRLNGTSDRNWKDVILDYPYIQFYDYSKVYNRVKKNWPTNYHLTLSYSEANSEYRDKVVEYANNYNTNLAVVFRDKDKIPATFLGRPVINGDADDLRFLDPEGVVVALYAKGKAKHDQSGFVID
jgi:hypothetical protein